MHAKDAADLFDTLESASAPLTINSDKLILGLCLLIVLYVSAMAPVFDLAAALLPSGLSIALFC